MEEIRVYHSPWRILLMALGCFVFIALSIFMLNNPKSVFSVIVAWIGIAFFGLASLSILYSLFMERLMNKPFLTITDTSIISQGIKTDHHQLCRCKVVSSCKDGRPEVCRHTL